MSQSERYRDFDITYVYPPIPIRTMDWCWSHKDVDEGDNRYGYEASLEACKAAIDDWYLDQEGLSDAEQKAQGKRCGCAGTDDYCVCQNRTDKVTRESRTASNTHTCIPMCIGELTDICQVCGKDC